MGVHHAQQKKKQIGAFWATKPYLSTTLEREFVISNKTVAVIIEEGVAISVADKVIPLIATGAVTLMDDRSRREFKELDVSKLFRISNGYPKGEYQVEFPKMKILSFKLEKGQVVVTNIEQYLI